MADDLTEKNDAGSQETTDAGSADMEAKKKLILELTSKKHVKIWLLHDICLLKNKEIVDAMGTGNVGGVGNVLKDYNEHPEKIEQARKTLELSKQPEEK